LSKTSRFGTGKRESHDSSEFYNSGLYTPGLTATFFKLLERIKSTKRTVPQRDLGEWTNQIYRSTSERMGEIPDESVGLVFTSPPYNVGKEYDQNLDLMDYLLLMCRVGSEVYRVLKPGGRYVINIANLGRKPYIPMTAYFYLIHGVLEFQPAGEIIWQKAKGANNSCAWGSWMSARAPRIRDIHEYLLVFAKDDFSRPDKGESDISRDEFMSNTLSIWEVMPESAKKIGHPAPFPVELASRVIRSYSYVDDVILDPFCGSGTTCLAAKLNGRPYVGYEIMEEYCDLAERRLLGVGG